MPYVAPTANNIGAHLFGGRNRRGAFGGGYYEGEEENYELGQAGEMNFRYDVGAQQAQDAMRGDYLQGSALADQQDVRNQLTNSLFGTLNGTQPSVAEAQLLNTTQQNVGNQFGMAQTGGNNPANLRAAMTNAGNINANAASAAAMLRAREVADAQGALGNVRGQDMQLYGQTSGALQGFLTGQRGLQQSILDANMQYERDRASNFNSQPQGAIGTIANMAGQVGGAMTGMGALGGAASALMPKKAFGGRVEPTTDSTRLDVVPTLLSPGEVVLPRSVVNDEDAPEKAKLFVEAIKKKYSKGGYVRC